MRLAHWYEFLRIRFMSGRFLHIVVNRQHLTGDGLCGIGCQKHGESRDVPWVDEPLDRLDRHRRFFDLLNGLGAEFCSSLEHALNSRTFDGSRQNSIDTEFPEFDGQCLRKLD